MKWACKYFDYILNIVNQLLPVTVERAEKKIQFLEAQSFSHW